jgi:hypothetical protein
MDKICGIEVPSIVAVPAGKYELTLVATAGIPFLLEQVGHRLEETIKEHTFGEYDYAELTRRLKAGEAQLWIVAEKGARVVLLGVSRILKYPCKKRLSVDLIVGEDLDGCATLLDIAGAWAKQFGCTEVEATCRPGVRKVMAKHGFTKAYDVIVKPIHGSTH